MHSSIRTFSCLPAIALAIWASFATPSVRAASAPPQALAAGYAENTFSTTAFTTSNVDTVDKDSTFPTGYQWYPAKFYFNHATDAASIAIQPNGTIVLNSDGTDRGNGNGEISSFAADASKPSGFAGTSFGGGAYFEAEFTFDPKLVFGGKGWPSWWGMATEHLSSGTCPGNFWNYYAPGTAPDGYAHFCEPDFFEYDVASPDNPDVWGGNMNDWFGVWTKEKGYTLVSSTWPEKQMRVPKGTDFTRFHKYGYLWVPATATSKGYARYFFDDVEVTPSPITWTLYSGQAPPVTQSSPWRFGIQDQQHIGLIIGSGVGQPMTVRAVNVWQKTSNWNIDSDTLYDPLNDLSLAASTLNMAIDHGNPVAFVGDTSRAVRRSLSDGVICYRVAGLGSFAVRVFRRGGASVRVDFQESGDDTHWSTLRHVRRTDGGATTDAWSYADYAWSAKKLLGSRSFRIVVSGGSGKPEDVQIGAVRIN